MIEMYFSNLFPVGQGIGRANNFHDLYLTRYPNGIDYNVKACWKDTVYLMVLAGLTTLTLSSKTEEKEGST